MNNDYLWNRTGSDAEIERLETILGDLAFRPDEPPRTMRRESVLEPRRPSWFVRFGLGFAAASTAAVPVVFFLITTRNALPPEGSAAALAPAPKNEVRSAEPSTELKFEKASAVRPGKRTPKKRQTRRVAKTAPSREGSRPLPVITLTAEERDAYRQLMTALAITGEKLNIVRDKLDGTR